MKTRTLYALFVAINTYPEGSHVRPLSGCINDVVKMDQFLACSLPANISYCSMRLLNTQATREEIIRGFRNHLSQAKSGDIVLFMYAGHGARQPAAPQFARFYPDAQDETLVCYNSRLSGQLDLADKELAVLLSEVVSDSIHGLVILDCCHSGSGTRSEMFLNAFSEREASPHIEPRKLHTYLDGYYSEMLHGGGHLTIPRSKHLLISACDRHQKASEHFMGFGVFSNALLQVLKHRGLHVSYRKLFQECKQSVQKSVCQQTPQFEAVLGVSVDTGFLDIYSAPADQRSAQVPVIFEGDQLFVNWGEVHGILLEKISRYSLEIFRLGEEEPFATTSFCSIGFERSSINDFGAGQSIAQGYEVRLLEYPVPLISIHYDGIQVEREKLSHFLPQGYNLVSDTSQTTFQYGLCHIEKDLTLIHLGSKKRLLYVPTANSEQVGFLMDAIRQISVWETIIKHVTSRNPEIFPILDIDFGYDEASVGTPVKSGNRVVLCWEENEIHKSVYPKLRVRNQHDKTLYFVLLYLSGQYGIEYVFANQIVPGPNWISYWGSDKRDELFLEQGENFALESFALIVSEEPLDYHQLTFSGLNFGKEAGHRKSPNPYFTPQKKWATYGVQFLLCRSLGWIGKEKLEPNGTTFIVHSHDEGNARVTVFPTHLPGLSGHPAQFGRTFVQKWKGIAQILPLSKEQFWDGDTLCISDVSGKIFTGKGLNVTLSSHFSKGKVICVALFNGDVFLLSTDCDRVLDGWKLTLRGEDLFSNGESGAKIWLWFFHFKDPTSLPTEIVLFPEEDVVIYPT